MAARRAAGSIEEEEEEDVARVSQRRTRILLDAAETKGTEEKFVLKKVLGIFFFLASLLSNQEME